LLFWLVALVMWRAHPWFGIGMGRYDARFIDELLAMAQGPYGDTLRNLTPKMVSLRAVHAHNDYVQFLAEWGAVGFGLFFLGALLVLAAAIRVVRRDLHRTTAIALMGVGLCAAYGSFLVQLAYDFPLNLPASELLFFLLAGAILVFEGESTCHVRRWGFSSRLVCVAVGLLCMAPCAWTLPRLSAKLSASHHLYHGQNNARAGLDDIADREYEIAAGLDPENGEISFHRAVNFANMDKISQALNQYAYSVETHQTSAYYYHLGITYIAQRNYSRARQYLEKLILINPQHRGANYALGLCFFYNPFGPDYSRAAEFFARELDEYPDGPDSLKAWLHLGESKLNLQDLYGARDAFRGAREFDDRNVQANERLGDIYAGDGPIGDPRVALEYYAAALVVANELGFQQKVAELVNKINAIQKRLPLK
jgi:tetratricopeptide (TPR) repeat protein